MSTRPCYLLLGAPRGTPPTENELRKRLMEGDDHDRILAMKDAIALLLNGEKLDSLLIVIIQFVLPSKNKKLKKLMIYYFEIVDKAGKDGQLRREFILVW